MPWLIRVTIYCFRILMFGGVMQEAGATPEADRGSVLDAALLYIRYLEGGQTPGRRPFVLAAPEEACDDKSLTGRKRRKGRLHPADGSSSPDAGALCGGLLTLPSALAKNPLRLQQHSTPTLDVSSSFALPSTLHLP